MNWTDADFTPVADLLTLDPEVQDIATNEQIDISASIRRGIEDAGRQLERKLLHFSNFRSSGDLSANHLAAVFNVGGQATQRGKISLEQVVVSGRNATYWSDVKSWVMVKVLRNFYRTAMNRATSDRYEHKFNIFGEQERNEYWPAFKSSGVPVVYKPLAAPGAVQARSAGTFALSAPAGAGTYAGVLDVVVTYVNDTVSSNGESHPSAVQSVALTAGQVLRVDITNLNPPTGVNESGARVSMTPLAATGWNVYAAVDGADMRLQNATPIPIATKTYTLAGNVSTTGAVVGLGQRPETYITIIDMLFRG